MAVFLRLTLTVVASEGQDLANDRHRETKKQSFHGQFVSEMKADIKAGRVTSIHSSSAQGQYIGCKCFCIIDSSDNNVLTCKTEI